MAFALTLASLSFIPAVIWGQPLIRLLRLWRTGTSIREELPGKYQEKMGAPTMGGLTVIIPVLLLTIALNIANLVNPAPIPTGGTQAVISRSILVPMGVMVGFAVLGGLDDYVSVRGTRRGERISGRWFLLAQVTIALATGAVLYFWLGYHNAALPGVSQPVKIGAFYIPIAALIIVCTTKPST